MTIGRTVFALAAALTWCAGPAQAYAFTNSWNGYPYANSQLNYIARDQLNCDLIRADNSGSFSPSDYYVYSSGVTVPIPNYAFASVGSVDSGWTRGGTRGAISNYYNSDYSVCGYESVFNAAFNVPGIYNYGVINVAPSIHPDDCANVYLTETWVWGYTQFGYAGWNLLGHSLLNACSDGGFMVYQPVIWNDDSESFPTTASQYRVSIRAFDYYGQTLNVRSRVQMTAYPFHPYLDQNGYWNFQFPL